MKEAKARQSKKVARGSKAAQSKKPTQPKRPTQSKKAAGRPKDFGKLFHDLDAVHHFVQGGALHTDDIMILVHLGQSAQPGADTASGLASTLHISRPRTSRSLARLAAAGLVQEVVQRSDYRVSHYRLSNHGENVFFEIRRRFGAQHIDALFQDYCTLQLATREAESQAGERKLSDSAQRIYLVLHAATKPLSLSALIEATGLAQNRLSQAVAVLQSKGQVKLEPGKTDARQRIVSLTTEGKRIAKCFAHAF